MSLVIDSLLIIQAFLVFLFTGYEYLTLMNFPALPSRVENYSDPPFVSIILPLRNQAKTAADCVRSLIGLEYHKKEIIVVEGHSNDGTQQILQQFQEKIILVEEAPLPPGWVGKNWACHQGYQKSRGRLLLFTDGDSVHSTDSLTRTVRYLHATEADLLTLAPGAILRTFWEKLLQPPIFMIILLLVGGKWVNNDKRRNALGNGQYMLIRRDPYEKVGGHSAVRDKIVEDYTIARRIKAAGFRLRMVTASDALGVRMYSSLSEIWRGWRKNFYTVSPNHNLARASLRLILMFSFLILPFVVLAYGILLVLRTPLNIFLVTGGFMAVLLWLGIIVLDRSIEVGLGFALLFPLAILFYIGIGVDSTVRGALGLGFPWKGRVYGKPDVGQPTRIA